MQFEDISPPQWRRAVLSPSLQLISEQKVRVSGKKFSMSFLRMEEYIFATTDESLRPTGRTRGGVVGILLRL